MTPFDIVDNDGIYAIKAKDSCVVILPYILDSDGSIEMIGVVEEKNPHFEAGTYKGPVMGGLEKGDSSIIQRAKLEMEEETGYNVQDLNRWIFLGQVYASKTMPDPIYCYAVNITDLKGEAPKGDGSSQEEGIKFHLLPLSEIWSVPDALLYTCFFKLFSSLYKNQII